MLVHILVESQCESGCLSGGDASETGGALVNWPGYLVESVSDNDFFVINVFVDVGSFDFLFGDGNCGGVLGARCKIMCESKSGTAPLEMILVVTIIQSRDAVTRNRDRVV